MLQISRVISFPYGNTFEILTKHSHMLYLNHAYSLYVNSVSERDELLVLCALNVVNVVALADLLVIGN